MKLTKKQKALLHIVPQRLGIDDDQRRIIQRSVGGFHSAKDGTCTHEGFAAVMAFYEDRADGRLPDYTPGYWRAQNDRNESRGGVSTDRLVYACRREAHRLGWSDRQLEIFFAGPHMSSGRCRNVDGASAYWLRRLLDALKAIGLRESKQESAAV